MMTGVRAGQALAIARFKLTQLPAANSFPQYETMSFYEVGQVGAELGHTTKLSLEEIHIPPRK